MLKLIWNNVSTGLNSFTVAYIAKEDPWGEVKDVTVNEKWKAIHSLNILLRGISSFLISITYYKFLAARSKSLARLLRLWVRIPPGSWMSVCCECCLLSGRGLCDGLVTRPEEFYLLWCLVVCDLETSWMRRPWPTGGCSSKNKQTNYNSLNI
jgi:hypothetical protein